MAEEQRLTEEGFLNLRHGPEDLKRALCRLRENSRTKRPLFHADLGPFYDWLRDQWDDEALASITRTTRQHICSNYPVSPDKKIFGEKPAQKVWFTLEEARKQSGLSVIFLKKLIGHMNGVSEKEALTLSVVHVKDIAKAKSYREKLTNLKDAAGQLGVTVHQVKALQDHNVLTTVKLTSALRYVLRDEVENLVSQIELLPEAPPGASVVPLKEYCRANGVHFARVIDQSLRNEMDGKLFRGEGEGLSAIEVGWKAQCGGVRVSLTKDLTVREAARYLQIKVTSIRNLRDNGYLTQVQRRNPDTNHLKQYISKASLRAFEKRYVTLGQMASHQKVEPYHLARALDREGIDPISCGKALVRAYDKCAVNWAGCEDA